MIDKHAAPPPHQLSPIARVRTDFPSKFGVPRQSGLAGRLLATVVFEPAFRTPDALRGIEGFSHLWLIWQFSHALREGWSATVRPPRLGGNARVGVFATRSPFRPNALGLSCVKLERVAWDTPEGAVLHVSGADLVDGTPVYDIKPYLPYADCRPEATGGFSEEGRQRALSVVFPPEWLAMIPSDKRDALRETLACDPRPAYQADAARRYGFAFAGFDIRFTVSGDVLTVREVVPL